MPRPTYDYVTDALDRVDGAVIGDVIEEAENYTRAAATPEPIREKLGTLAMSAFLHVGQWGRHMPV